MAKGKSFSLKFSGAVDNIAKHWKEEVNQIDGEVKKRVSLATGLVWSVAHAKRPKVSPAKGNKGKYRVSDPGAEAGVPVATGALQLSVQKKVFQKKGNWTGSIVAGGGGVGYAGFVEFGTSRMQARPFMRPALDLNSSEIKKIMTKEMK
jgi:HK97 gp10 family phage protein